MTHVLAVVDDETTAAAVLDTAALLAQSLALSMRAVQVGPESVAAEERAAALGVGLEPLVAPTGPAALSAVALDAAVEDLATDPEVDLIVLGLARHAPEPIPGALVHTLVDSMHVPLVLVPADWALRRTPRRVLFPVDGTLRVSEAARPFIATYVAAGYEVHALHVFDPHTVPHFHDGPEDDEVWRDEFVAEHFAELEVQLTTRPGPLVPVLLATAEQHEADIIALPVRPDASESESSVLRQVLEAADRPVALVPMPRRTAQESAAAISRAG